MITSQRVFRVLVQITGAAMLLQTGTCANLTPAQADELRNQFFLPQLASVVSDAVFFLLDNALVRLTT